MASFTDSLGLQIKRLLYSRRMTVAPRGARVDEGVRSERFKKFSAKVKSELPILRNGRLLHQILREVLGLTFSTGVVLSIHNQMKPTGVTDLDYIVGLGYQEAAARDALHVTHGNRNAALYLLSKKGSTSGKGQQSWRKETADEWVDHSARATPNIAENRAMHKSPFYVFVEHYHTPPQGDEYIFEMEITLRDGRQWKIGRTYPEFYNLWLSLPLGTCMSFTNSFPPSAAVQFVFGELSKTFLEKRLRGLNEWMRELVLNEDCMSNPKILDLLYAFTEADKNGGKPGQKGVLKATSTSAPSAPPAPLPNIKSPLMMVGQDSMEAAAAKRMALYYSQAPLLSLEHLPVTPHHPMPFKVNLKKLQCYHDLIGMKLSAEEKAAQDAARRQEDAVLAAVMAESEAEARTMAEQDKPMVARKPVQEHSTAGLLHSLDKAKISATTEPALTSSSGVPVVHDAQQETSLPPARTHSLPLQIARPVDASTPDVATLKRLQSSTSVLGLKIDEEQLQKDCHRDRLVVQGKRLLGVDTHLDRVYALCQESILQAMTLAEKKYDLGGLSAQKAGNPFEDTNETNSSTNPFDEDVDSPMPSDVSSPHTAPLSRLQRDLEQFCRVALSVISRTESGYLSHAALSEIFDIENKHHQADFAPFIYVPESGLSDPLQLSFAVLEKGGAPQASRGKYAQPALAEEWCVECTGETSTVYRLMDAVTLVPLLQIRVSYLVTLFAMPQCQTGQMVSGFTMKEGKCTILIDKVTTTTSRDWDSCA